MASEPAGELRAEPTNGSSAHPGPNDAAPAISRLKAGDNVVTASGGTGQPARAPRRRRARDEDVGALRLVAIATLMSLVTVMAIVVWLVWLR
jgi:hypothetical protein